MVVTKLELRYTPGAKWSSRIWAGKGGGSSAGRGQFVLADVGLAVVVKGWREEEESHLPRLQQVKPCGYTPNM